MVMREMAKPDRAMRYTVVALLLSCVTINYIDRQTLSVLMPILSKDLHISSLQYSYIVNSFLVVYAVMYVLTGRIIDRLGARRGLGIAVTWWSLAEMLHGLANGAFALCVARALLAMGEAAIIPSSVKLVAEWFSAKQRSLAVGIVEMGLSLGPVMAPPLIVWIALRQGWRYGFFWVGLAGIVWTLPWWIFYRSPEVTPENLTPVNNRNSMPWSEVLRSKPVWAVGFARFFADPVWYFYLFWLPKYLSESRGLSIKSIGVLAWIPYAASLLGGLAGGAASSWLAKRGVPPLLARKRVMLLSGGLVSLGVLSTHFSSVLWILVVISTAAFAIMAWGVNLDTLPTDLFESGNVAQVMGLVGFMGASGGMLFTLATGYLVQNFSYTPVWIASALMYPLGYFLLSTLLRDKLRLLVGSGVKSSPSVEVSSEP